MKIGNAAIARLLSSLFAAALVLAPATAFAHGETTTTEPEAGAALRKTPKSVSVSLTEPPAEGARFTVTDGCGDVVSQAQQVDGALLSTDINRGQPGTWRANYKVISSVDGHVTKDEWRFKVAGKKDCSPDEPKKNDKEDPTADAGADPRGNARGPGEDDGGSFPVVPVALGTVGLVALAVVIRTRATT